MRIALAILFSGGLVYFFSRHLSGALLKSILLGLKTTPALLSLGIYVVLTAIRAWRFRLAGSAAGGCVLFRIAAIHAALLRIMPLRSGELAYGFMLRRTHSGGMAEGIATIVVLRLLDVIVILPLVAFALLQLTALAPPTWLPIGLAGAFLLAVTFYFALGALGRSLVERFFAPTRSASKGVGGKLASAITQVTDLSLSRRLSLLGVTAFLWAMVLVWFHFSLLAIGAVFSWEDGIRVGILGVTGSIVPLSLVGSFGPMESGFALGLSACGQSARLAAANAVIVSGLTFLANWVVALPCLLVEVFFLRRR